MQTKIIALDPLHPDKQAIGQAAAIIRRGGLVAFPTETVYGLGGDATNCEAVKKIYQAKGRASDNPLIIHIAAMSDLARYAAAVPESAKKLAAAFWPGPLTMILPKKEIIPAAVSGGLDTVAVRLPSDQIARSLIRAAGTAIAAPSANLSGKPSPTTPAHVIADLNGRVEMILAAGSCTVGLESTVISLTGATARLLRPGGITYEMLCRVLGDVEIDAGVTHRVDDRARVASPGMKYKHYAPNARLTLVKGGAPACARYIKAHILDPGKEGVVCFDEETPLYAGYRVFPYGGRDQDNQQGQRLFAVLRSLDQAGITRAYVRCPDTAGVGLAVYNRLLRAAAFDLVEV